MARQLLTALKTSGAKPSSHEARLGIMVITILVFAFGFLVYHKMNLHQQNLTRAAIAPTGTASSDVPQANPVVGIVGQESMTESFDALDEPAVTQPRGAEQVEEPAASRFAADRVVELELHEDSTSLVVDEPPLQQRFTMSDSSETESPDFTVTAETPNVIESLPSFPEPAAAFANIEAEAVMAQAETSGEQPDSNEINFNLSAGEPTSSEPEQASEPVLLAMAEPQQSGGFDNGFLQDASAPTAKAFPEEPAESSTFFPAPSEQAAGSAPQKQHSDSRGFNAVKNPGGRKPGNLIRTAAGSGSDGKFSLAAFNYQNGVSQSAPDDGSTFDSVVVQDGDNYTKISKRVYGTVKYFAALAVFNQHRISEPKNMRPGMVVLVPAKEVLEERYPEFFFDSQPKTPEPAEFLLLDDGTPAYRVGERETISEISERFLGRSSRWIEIYRLNQSIVKDPNKLKAGLILALPADAAEVNVVP